jgi:hypothetical protein
MVASSDTNLARMRRPSNAAGTAVYADVDAARDGSKRSRSNALIRKATSFRKALAVRKTRDLRSIPQNCETRRIESDRSVMVTGDHRDMVQATADQENSPRPRRRRAPFPGSNPNGTWSFRLNNSMLPLAHARSVASLCAVRRRSVRIRRFMPGRVQR